MRENFIEDLTNQFSDLLVPNSRHHSVALPDTSAGTSLLVDPDLGLPEGQPVNDGRVDQEMVADGDQDEERKSLSGGSDDHDAINEESDEEDSNMIPDEKPDGASGPAGGGAIGDETELDLLNQINELESQE